MDIVRGRIAKMRVYEEEGRTDWVLALSKVCWCGICLLFPVSLFRFINEFFGLVEAIIGVIAFGILMRLFGIFNLVMLDELLSRLFPSLRSAVRMGMVNVYDFRVQTAENREVACLLKGDLWGSRPTVGDQVRLEGRNKRGTFWVRRGINENTHSLIVLRPSHSLCILCVTGVIMGFFLLYVMGTLDEFIYPWIDSIFRP
jgi:hypothetical protein